VDFPYSPELEAEARALAAAEVGCCSFFEFDIARRGNELHWTTVVPPGKASALSMLDELGPEASPPRV
jgi:hypothetical protein